MIIGVPAVPAARAPAEKVNPAAVGGGNVSVVATANCSTNISLIIWGLSTHIIPLVLSKLPRIGAGLVLQIALREIHLAAIFVDGKLAIDGTRGDVALRRGYFLTWPDFIDE